MHLLVEMLMQNMPTLNQLIEGVYFYILIFVLVVEVCVIGP